MSRKIIFTVTSDLNTDQRMQRICRSMYNNGYEILLIGRKIDSYNLSFEFPIKRLSCLFNKGFLFYAEYNIRLFFFLLFKDCNIICSVDLDTMLPCKMVSRLKGIKLVYDAHEYYTESPELDNRPRLKAFWEWIGRRTIPAVTDGYTVNKSIALFLEEKYTKRFSVIRNLPHYNQLSSKNSSFKHNYLLYQGVLNKGRGLEELILAMKEIDLLPLWIAGSGDIETDLKALVKKEELGSRVRFLGKLEPQKLLAVTVDATIGFNLLDPSNKNYYYSLANKYFDYMAAGVPGISMDFPEYASVNKKYEIAILLQNLNPSEIAAAINNLLNDQAKYDQLKLNCIQASEVYNWKQEEKKLLAFYENLMSTE